MNPSAELFKAHAKHFIVLRTDAHDPQGRIPDKTFFGSAFVVDVLGLWCLVTAAHVVQAVQEAKSQGVVFDGWTLHDETAGHHYPGGVPLPVEDSGWLEIRSDAKGLDLALTVLSPNVVDLLKKGGVEPIAEEAWIDTGPFDFAVLVGLPSERMVQTGAFSKAMVVQIPLDPTAVPVGHEGKFGMVFGKLRWAPGADHVPVTDIDGMSGGPVYGVREVDGAPKYWLLGVQSGWLASSRTVFICPAIDLLMEVRKVVDAVLREIERLDRHYAADPAGLALAMDQLRRKGLQEITESASEP